MISKEVTVKFHAGLEPKSATVFIQKASKYNATIWIEREERKANAKSLLGVLSLGIPSKAKVIVIADGDDEQRAIHELSTYLEAGSPDE